MQQNNKNGFTVVEILIVVPIVVLMIGIFITAVVSMTSEVLTSRGANALIYNIHDALNRIEQDVKLSNGYLATNSFTLTAPQGMDDSTSMPFVNTSSQGSALILSSVATTNNPLSSSRNVVHSNTPNACNSLQVDQNAPITTNIVYFVKNGALWRRVVMPANYTTVGFGCNSITKTNATIWQQATCAPYIPIGAFCKANDTKLTDGIINATGFIVNYYSTPDSTNPNSIANDHIKSNTERQNALTTNTTLSVTINATKTISGKDISQTGTVRVTLAK